MVVYKKNPSLAESKKAENDMSQKDSAANTQISSGFQPNPANDDRRSVGALMYKLQRRPSVWAFWCAFILSCLWGTAGFYLLWERFGGMALTLADIGPFLKTSSGLTFIAIGIVPIILFWIMAMVIYRGQEMRLIARGMTEIALRLTETHSEEAISESILSLSHTIRREVSAMGDGVERAISRAGELESLVQNEVLTLERSYHENELKVRGLIEELITQRELITTNASQLREVLSGVHTDLGGQLATSSQAIQTILKGTVSQLSSDIEARTNVLSNSVEQRIKHLSNELLAAGELVISRLEEKSHSFIGGLMDSSHHLVHTMTQSGSELTEKITQKINDVDAHVHHLGETMLQKVGDKHAEIHTELSRAGENILHLISEKTDKLQSELTYEAQNIIGTMTTHTNQFQDALKKTGGTTCEQIEFSRQKLEETLEKTESGISDSLKQKSHLLQKTFEETGALVTTSLHKKFQDLTRSLESQVISVNDVLNTTRIDVIGSLDAKAGDVKKTFEKTGHLLEDAFDEKKNSIIQSFLTAGDSVLEDISQRTGLFVQKLEETSQSLEETVCQKGGALTEELSRIGAGLSTIISHDGAEFERSIIRQTDYLSKTFQTAGHQMYDGLKASSHEAETLLRQTSTTLTEQLAQTGKGLVDLIDVGSSRLSNQIQTATDVLRQTVTQTSTHFKNGLQEHTGVLTQLFDEKERSFFTAIEAQTRHTYSVLETELEKLNDMFLDHTKKFSGVLSQRAKIIEDVLINRSDELVGALGQSSETLEKMLLSKLDHTVSHLERRSTELSELYDASAKAFEERIEKTFHYFRETLEKDVYTTSDVLTQKHDHMVQLFSTIRSDMNDFLEKHHDQLSTGVTEQVKKIDMALSQTTEQVSHIMKERSEGIRSDFIEIIESFAHKVATDIQGASNTLDTKALQGAEALKASISALDQLLLKHGTQAGETLIVQGQDIAQKFAHMVENFENTLTHQEKTLQEDFKRLVQEVNTSFTSGKVSFQNVLKESDETARTTLDTHAQETDTVLKNVTERAVHRLSTQSDLITQNVHAMLEKASRNLEKEKEDFSEFFRKNESTLVDFVSGLTTSLEGAITKACERLQVGASYIQKTLSQGANDTEMTLSDQNEKMASRIHSISQDMNALLAQTQNTLTETLNDIFTGMGASLMQETGKIQNVYADIYHHFKTGLKQQRADIREEMISPVDALQKAIAQQSHEACEQINTSLEKMQSSFGTSAETIKRCVKDVLETSLVDLEERGKTVATDIETHTNRLTDHLQKGRSDIVITLTQKGEDVLNSLDMRMSDIYERLTRFTTDFEALLQTTQERLIDRLSTSGQVATHALLSTGDDLSKKMEETLEKTTTHISVTGKHVDEQMAEILSSFEKQTQGLQDFVLKARENIGQNEEGLTARMHELYAVLNRVQMDSSIMQNNMDEAVKNLRGMGTALSRDVSNLLSLFDGQIQMLINLVDDFRKTNASFDETIDLRNDKINTISDTLFSKTNHLGRLAQDIEGALVQTLQKADQKIQNLSSLLKEAGENTAHSLDVQTQNLCTTAHYERNKSKQLLEGMQEKIQEELVSVVNEATQKILSTMDALQTLSGHLTSDVTTLAKAQGKFSEDVTYFEKMTDHFSAKKIGESLSSSPETGRFEGPLQKQTATGVRISSSSPHAKSPDQDAEEPTGERKKSWMQDLLSRASRKEATDALSSPPSVEAFPDRSDRHNDTLSGQSAGPSLSKTEEGEPSQGADKTQEAASSSPAQDYRLERFLEDIACAFDHQAYCSAWEKTDYERPLPVSSSIYTGEGQKIYALIKQRVEKDSAFREMVIRYIKNFESIIDQLPEGGHGRETRRDCLFSDKGKIYTLFADASGYFSR